MIGSGRLEVDPLERPAHRPVDLPDQLALVLGGQVGDALESTRPAGVGQVGALVVVRRQLGGVARAVAAVRLEREPGEVGGLRLGLIIERDRIGQGLGLLGVLAGHLLGAIAAEHLVDLAAPTDRGQDLVAVVAGGVLGRLVLLLHLAAHLDQSQAQRLLEVLGPGRMALPRVRDRGQRPAHMLVPRLVDPHRHLAEPVVVVPTLQMPHRDPAPPDLVGHEVHGQELAQVAQMDRTRGTDPGGAGDQVALTGVPDRCVRRAGHPVARVTVRTPVASCHLSLRLRGPIIAVGRGGAESRFHSEGRNSRYAARWTRQVRSRSGPKISPSALP